MAIGYLSTYENTAWLAQRRYPPVFLGAAVSTIAVAICTGSLQISRRIPVRHFADFVLVGLP